MRAASLLAAALVVPGAGGSELIAFTPQEIRRIVSHGPWPQPVLADPSNRVTGDPAAIALGARLFFDARLSSNGAVACATCHVPSRAWTDGRPRAIGLAGLDRNTPSVVNAGLGRWFGWDGGADSIWSQGLRAMLDAREMGGSPALVAGAIRADRGLACAHEAAFGAGAAARDDTQVMVDAAKGIAAFVATLGSGRTPFDDFRDALARGDRGAAARYPAAAQRGARIFAGRGNCSVCHFGPAFTNGEFHEVGVPYTLGGGKVDPGRHGGIKRLQGDPFNLLGKYSDDASGAAATKTRHVEMQHANFGQFKTPSLRNVALTAPYMHDGRLATLPDVVRHYSELDMERIHVHGEQLLQPLKLSAEESADLAAFLESLSDPAAATPPSRRDLPPGCGSGGAPAR
jgi:cytochrome c peroxidase